MTTEMPDTRESQPAFWLLTVATALALALLMGLGFWQLQRKTWKEGLIATLAERKTAPPISLSEALTRQQDGGDIAFTRVNVEGEFLHQHERYMFRHQAKFGPGVEVFTPLQLSSDRGVIWINRGFVPDAVKQRSQRRQGLLEGPQQVTGALRLNGHQGAFVPNNNVADNLWYWRDLQAMSASVGKAVQPRSWQKVSVDAEQAAPGGWPDGGGAEISLTNRHFSYALTWFGLAGTLIAVYIALVISRRRQKP